jgi:uncharacterized integral membrane protein
VIAVFFFGSIAGLGFSTLCTQLGMPLGIAVLAWPIVGNFLVILAITQALYQSRRSENQLPPSVLS